MGVMLAVDGGADTQILGCRFLFLMVVITVAQGEGLQLAPDTQLSGILAFCGHLYPQGYGCPPCKIQFHLKLAYLAVEVVDLLLMRSGIRLRR